MARGFTSLLAVLLLAGIPGFGQIIPGVGYPGQRRGGYPGGPAQSPRTSNQDNTTTFTGMLRKIEDKDVIVESDDKTITTISTGSSTKYASASGGSAKIGDFQPGDHVKVSTKQDGKNVYHAVRMTMVTAGTKEEHSIASLAMDDTSRPLPDRSSDGSPSSTGSSSSRSASNSSVASSGSSNGDHPTLRRAASSSTDNISTDNTSTSSSSSSSDNDPDRPKLRRAGSGSDVAANGSSNSSSSNPSSGSSSGSDNARPRVRKAISGSDDGSPKAEITPGDSATIAAPPQDSGGNSGPPQLRRANPSTGSDPVVADARPNLHAGDVNGVTRTPSPPQVGASEGTSSAGLRMPQRMPSSGDPFIDQAREAAFSFSETLPNYVVKQFTTRYMTAVARGGKTTWQALDNVTADVIEEDGNEKYKNILVNGKPPLRDVEKTGSWSRGEFSSLQLDVLSPLTNADFHGKRTTTIVNRAAFRFDFSVAQPNSHWHVESEGQSYQPAYTGSIWIDKENYRVLRIELSAQSMPREFPLDQVESAVDYDYVLIGEGKYLLPTHSEALSCAHGATNCTRNVIEFRNYKKFTADTSITFEADK
jgi:hypothetical protein